jgi:hypothetical protein
VTGQWFSPGTPVSAKILLLKVSDLRRDQLSLQTLFNGDFFLF